MIGKLAECPTCHKTMEPGYLWGLRGLRWTPARQGKQGWEFSNWVSNEPVNREWKLPLCNRCLGCGIYWFTKSEDSSTVPLP